MSLTHLFQVFEATSHVILELLVHLFLFPHESLYVLHAHNSRISVLIDWISRLGLTFSVRKSYLNPLEVTYGDSS